MTRERYIQEIVCRSNNGLKSVRRWFYLPIEKIESMSPRERILKFLGKVNSASVKINKRIWLAETLMVEKIDDDRILVCFNPVGWNKTFSVKERKFVRVLYDYNKMRMKIGDAIYDTCDFGCFA